MTPEEEVRQHFIRFLIEEKSFPSSLMVIERSLTINGNRFRADLVVCTKQGTPMLVAEFKAPSVKISQDAFDQIARYNMQFRVPFLIVSNGLEHYCCKIDFLAETYSFLKEIPTFEETNALR